MLSKHTAVAFGLREVTQVVLGQLHGQGGEIFI